jgi:hypothetical protein
MLVIWAQAPRKLTDERILLLITWGKITVVVTIAVDATVAFVVHAIQLIISAISLLMVREIEDSQYSQEHHTACAFMLEAAAHSASVCIMLSVHRSECSARRMFIVVPGGGLRLHSNSCSHVNTECRNALISLSASV